MPEVIYSPASEQDLDDVWDYIAGDSPFQADPAVGTIPPQAGVFGQVERAGTVRVPNWRKAAAVIPSANTASTSGHIPTV